jgi:acyl-CoA synthetase (AMP-forming)/AMP-acid ligase II
MNELSDSPSAADCISTQNDIVSILFTSGTTSLSKGVPHTDKSLNAFCQNLKLGGRTEKSKFCNVLPNNHAMGYFYTLHLMMHGASIIIPSWNFDAPAMVQALEMKR